MTKNRDLDQAELSKISGGTEGQTTQDDGTAAGDTFARDPRNAPKHGLGSGTTDGSSSDGDPTETPGR